MSKTKKPAPANKERSQVEVLSSIDLTLRKIQNIMLQKCEYETGQKITITKE